MKTRFFSGDGAELILFFHGWGMEPDSLADFPADGMDLLCCYDYTTLELDLPPLRRDYRKRWLVAWSMGVWAAANAEFENIAFDRAIALNGTLSPIDPELGIQPDIFRGTAENWLDEAARQAFCRRVYGIDDAPPERDPARQQQELLALENFFREYGPAANRYDLALVGRRDRIFAPKVQRLAWSRAGVPVVEDPGGHWPFEHFRNWREIVELGRPG